MLSLSDMNDNEKEIDAMETDEQIPSEQTDDKSTSPSKPKKKPVMMSWEEYKATSKLLAYYLRSQEDKEGTVISKREGLSSLSLLYFCHLY